MNPQENNKVIIVAGGTGGHVFPGLATAAELKRHHYDITWLGTKAGIESKLVPAHDIPIEYIQVGGVRGKSIRTLLGAPYKITKALLQSICIIRQQKPALVLGMGGFVSGPVGLAAWLCRVPLVLHEQNAVAGTTNRILSRLSKRVCTAFPNTGYLKESKVNLTGNPIRKDLCELPSPEARFKERTGKFRVLVIGGSQGALVLNTVIPKAIKALPDDKRPSVWHQCGSKKYDETKAIVGSLEDYKLEPFIDNMAEAYAWADLVIARAGALTVAELAAVGLGAILIPLPQAIDDHQTRNAEVLAGENAAIILPQGDLSPQSLVELLSQYTSNRDKLLTMAENAKKVAKLAATEDVANHCMEVCQHVTN